MRWTLCVAQLPLVMEGRLTEAEGGDAPLRTCDLRLVRLGRTEPPVGSSSISECRWVQSRRSPYPPSQSRSGEAGGPSVEGAMRGGPGLAEAPGALTAGGAGRQWEKASRAEAGQCRHPQPLQWPWGPASGSSLDLVFLYKGECPIGPVTERKLGSVQPSFRDMEAGRSRLVCLAAADKSVNSGRRVGYSSRAGRRLWGWDAASSLLLLDVRCGGEGGDQSVSDVLLKAGLCPLPSHICL